MIPKQLMQKKLRMKLQYLMAISLYVFPLLVLVSCAYNPQSLTPHFIDPVKMVTREYHVVQVTPEIIFEYTKENSIADAVKNNGGLLCLPVPQAQEIKRKYETYIRSKGDNNTEPNAMLIESNSTPIYRNTIKDDLKVINGIPYTN